MYQSFQSHCKGGTETQKNDEMVVLQVVSFCIRIKKNGVSPSYLLKSVMGYLAVLSNFSWLLGRLDKQLRFSLLVEL